MEISGDQDCLATNYLQNIFFLDYLEVSFFWVNYPFKKSNNDIWNNVITLFVHIMKISGDQNTKILNDNRLFVLGWAIPLRTLQKII